MTQVSRPTLGQALILLTVLLTAVLGVGLKYRRYAAPLDAAAPARIAERISAIAGHHGWAPKAHAGDGRETFQWLAFGKPGCSRPLIVALLKTSGDLDSLARTIYGPDVAFLDSSRPDIGSDTLLGAAYRRAKDLAISVSGQQSHVMPRLAVHPAPPAEPEGLCAGPPQAAWLDRQQPTLLSERMPHPLPN